jgi:hypothetical protein
VLDLVVVVIVVKSRLFGVCQGQIFDDTIYIKINFSSSSTGTLVDEQVVLSPRLTTFLYFANAFDSSWNSDTDIWLSFGN